MMLHLCTEGCGSDTAAWVAAGTCPADTSRVTTCVDGTLVTAPFLSPVDAVCIFVSLDVTTVLRGFSLRDIVDGSVENSCYKQWHDAVFDQHESEKYVTKPICNWPFCSFCRL